MFTQTQEWCSCHFREFPWSSDPNWLTTVCGDWMTSVQTQLSLCDLPWSLDQNWLQYGGLNDVSPDSGTHVSSLLDSKQDEITPITPDFGPITSDSINECQDWVMFDLAPECTWKHDICDFPHLGVFCRHFHPQGMNVFGLQYPLPFHHVMYQSYILEYSCMIIHWELSHMRSYMGVIEKHPPLMMPVMFQK